MTHTYHNKILPLRARADVRNAWLKERLDTLLYFAGGDCHILSHNVRREPVVSRGQTLRLIFRIIIVAWITVLSTIALAQSQHDELILIASPIAVENVTWSLDSENLIFQRRTSVAESGMQLEGHDWLQYDVSTGNLTESNIWPLRTDLTHSEIQVFDIPEISFRHVSPDQRYVVYGGPSVDFFSPLTIFDRQTQTHVATATNARVTGSGTDLFNVWWSEDSSAFGLMTTPLMSDARLFFYVSNYADDVNNVIIEDIFRTNINNHSYRVINIFDLSHDGSVVLLRIAGDGTLPARLVLWNATNPQNSHIIPASLISGIGVMAASFASGDETKIILLNPSGLILVDLITNTTTTLRTDINAGLFESALFSPDGKWLALWDFSSIHMTPIDIVLDVNASDRP